MNTIVLADDHLMLAEALRSVIEKEEDLQVVGIANNGTELLDLLVIHTPDLCVLDISMPEMDGISAMQIIRQKYPNLPVLALTMHDEPKIVRQMIEAGVSGYILKNRSQDLLVEAIRTILSGPEEVYFESEIKDKFIRIFSGRTPPSTKKKQDLADIRITSREKELLVLLAEGLTGKEIADKLCISEHTVSSHKTTLMNKLNIPNAAVLVRFAVEQGLISNHWKIDTNK